MGSARSGGSSEQAADGGFTPTISSTNPFKPAATQANLQKQNSMQVVSNFGSSSLLMAGSSQAEKGFKVPDSATPFAFQPHQASMPFEPKPFTAAPGYPMAANQSAEETSKPFGNWDGKDKQGKQTDVDNQGGASSTKKKQGAQGKGQKFVNVHDDTGPISNFSDFDKSQSFQKSKAHY